MAAAVLAVPGVAGLHGGMFGEAATYLPGRKVAGIRLADTGTTTVHVTVVYGRDIDEVAAAVRRAAAALIDGPVDVVVEDVAVPGADPLTEIARPSSPQPWSTA
nr:Asp23/Gls24 family envelope stress response protein [Rhodococcus sp. X156]